MKLALVLLLSLGYAAICLGCFPTYRGWGEGPHHGLHRNDWWCSTFYSFLGFTYSMEGSTCADYSYARFKSDFQAQKEEYNATFVRIYLFNCTETRPWVEMVAAARDTSVALIPMIFWDWGQNDPIMHGAENAFMGVFDDPEVGPIVPYVVHSVAFGDELGEQPDYWVRPMNDFKKKLAKYKIPIAISDDWDRPVYQTGSGLTDFGKKINALDDLTQAHIQPYYHPDDVRNVTYLWPYYQTQLNNLVANNKHPVIVSQTMWSYNQDGRIRGEYDQYDNMENYQLYWNTLNANCATFKHLKVGWFFYVWQQEPGFSLITPNGTAIWDWQPKFC
eukprot:Phypoly_transcript_13255.p1 GENE.Phypoly_transcript_13255~~Phypoly_transcript_13255.p1  ORF type:complete len:353 (-),score=30.86 Phypoly_transcript_13255:19-1014(-)